MCGAIEDRGAGNANFDAHCLRGYGSDFQGSGSGCQRLFVETQQPDQTSSCDAGSSFRWFTHVQFDCAQSSGLISKVEASRRETDPSLAPRGNGSELSGQGAYLQDRKSTRLNSS